MSAPRLSRSSAPRPGVGIVHLGLGAFYRAFGAIYVAEAMVASGGDWGITGVSLKSPTTRDALAPQGCAYSSVTLGPDGEDARIMEVLEDVRVAPEDPDSVLVTMTDPSVHIVSLTVTEKGYCHEPSTGRLNRSHPDIVHDLAAPLPKSAVGFLVRALQRRKADGLAPFTILSCDNLPDNGKMVRGVVLEFARLLDPALAEWIAEEARFPSTMVDRITPATTAQDIERVAVLVGQLDAAPVLHEPFRQWVIEDDFVADKRPDFGAVGVQMVADVTPFEHMKLRMLNGTHSALAYLGYLAGHETIAATMADPVFAAFVDKLWSEEIIPAVEAPPGVSLPEYACALAARYTNPAIRHRTWQIAMDGSQKLPQRILGTLAANLAQGRASPGLCLVVAGWMRYVGGVDEAGAPIDVRDPMAERLREVCDAAKTSGERVRTLLAVDEIFPPDLTPQIEEPVVRAYALLAKVGTREAVRQTLWTC